MAAKIGIINGFGNVFYFNFICKFFIKSIGTYIVLVLVDKKLCYQKLDLRTMVFSK